MQVFILMYVYAYVYLDLDIYRQSSMYIDVHIHVYMYIRTYILTGADIAEDYFNRDDPVPTTNEPLPLAYAFDVTNSALRSKFIPEGMRNECSIAFTNYSVFLFLFFENNNSSTI
jgi:hypothetical protein